LSVQYLPWVREGLLPNTVTDERGQAPLVLELSRDGTLSRTVTRPVTLVGPADIVGLPASQVLRRWPARGVSAAETEFFPLVELDDPSLPWLASPVRPEGARVGPWIALVVVEEGPGVVLESGPVGGSPQVLRLSAQASAELPAPADVWAWAHAQVDAPSTSPTDVATALGGDPDRTLARLLCPRRLLPHRRYLAAVVPVYEAGRRAGLGEGTEGASGFAWSPGVAADLPAYLSWTFQTGDAGNFGSLARQLFAAPIDPASPMPPLAIDVGVPLPESAQTVDWRAAVAAEGSVRRPVPPEAVTALRPAVTPVSSAVPVLAPPTYGARWRSDATVAPDPGESAPWTATANLDPSCRAAAGLGAELVRRHQDELMASAWRQLAESRESFGITRRVQLMQLAEGRLVERLAALPLATTDRVFGEAVTALQPEASDTGMFARPGRAIEARFLRHQPVSRDTRGAPTLPRLSRRTAVLTRSATASAAASSATSWLPTTRGGFTYKPAAVSVTSAVLTAVLPPPPDLVTPAPRFPRPLASWLASELPDAFRLGAELPENGVAVLRADPAFVEAVLLGANEEINRELLWRGFPCDGRRTPFQWFWDRPHRAKGTLPPPDVPPIETWSASQPLGAQAGLTSPSLLVVVRSELVRRYPTAVVALVQGELSGTLRRPRSDSLQLPSVRVVLGEDQLLVGFDGITAAQLVGHPGWYVVIAENVGDPRFGLDPPSENPDPAAPGTISWSHLSTPDVVVAAPSTFPVVTGLQPSTASAAHFASTLRQKPFRALIHGSRLVWS
jgi:hypothetical protein